MSELDNQKRGTQAAVVGSAAGLIPAISLAFYLFLSQEPDVAAQRAGYVAWALLLLSPYVLALVASGVREPGVRGGLLLGVGLLSLVGSFSTFSSIAFRLSACDTRYLVRRCQKSDCREAPVGDCDTCHLLQGC